MAEPKPLFHTTTNTPLPPTQLHISPSKTEPFVSRIIAGDVIQVLTSLNATNQFNVIIADPPYNIGKDFGATKDSMAESEYLEWSKGWIHLCLEALTSNGVLYVYGFPEILARIAVHYPIEQQRWLVWHYTNKTTPSSRFWQRSHESILCLWKGKRPTLYVNQIREPYTENYLKAIGKKRTVHTESSRFGKKATFYGGHRNGALPRDVIKTPALAGGAGRAERWFLCKTCDNTLYSPDNLRKHKDHSLLKHPTQKPMNLTKRLLQSCIGKNGGRALIPFTGSGSECIVANSLDIEYLGIEINTEYVEYANKWIEAYTDYV